MKKFKQASNDDLKLIEPLNKLSARKSSLSKGSKVITPANVASKRRDQFSTNISQFGKSDHKNYPIGGVAAMGGGNS